MDIDIAHIAKLAKLYISEEQIPEFQAKMSEIVDMVNQLPQVDEALTLDAENAMELRQDVAEDNKFTNEEMLANAPQTHNGCIVVPKTVE